MTACNPPRNDRFCPKADVSRGAMAVYLVRTFHLTATSGVRFRDVPKHGSKAKAIDKVVTAGIAAGCSKRRFCPDAAVTRGRMAVFVTRALKLTATARVRFDDVSTHHPFATAINRLATAGLAISCGEPPVLPEPRHQPRRDRRLPPRARSITRVTAPQPAPATRTGTRRSRRAPEPSTRRRPTTWSATGRRRAAPPQAVVGAVAKGGVITFDCGPSPVTITMTATAKVFNDRPDVVIDGGGQVTLDGGGARRILYMNTCDQA